MSFKKQLVSLAKRGKFTFRGKNPCLYITVHETGNTDVGANAQAHANLQSRGNSRNASWHRQVDDTQVIQSYKDTRQCWHASDGSGPGNKTSIAYELCVNSDGDFEATKRNAAKDIAKKMAERNIPLSHVVQHHRWSRKNCPTNLRAPGEWAKFLALIAKYSSAPARPAPSKPSKKKTVKQLTAEVIKGKHGRGDARKRALGSQYGAVQAEVNRRLGAKTKPKPKPKPKSKVTVLSRGYKGRKAGKLQRGLNKVFPAYRHKSRVHRGRLLAVDNSYGPHLAEWVGIFQDAVGITRDEVCGPDTQAHLRKYGIKL